VFMAILALGLFTMAARSITDPDVWWHLRTGQLILQNHSLFHTDPYSFTRFGQSWINHEWLSEVLLFGLYRVAGFGGLIVAFGVVISATLLLVFKRSSGRPYLASLMTLWGAVASAPSWGVRPQMFSLLLASIFLVLLEASEQQPKLLWWTAPLMLLWVNLHAGYPIGLAFIALFLLGEGLEAAIGGEPRQKSASRLKRLAMAFGLCLALVVLNPNGVQIYWYPFETLRSAAMHRFIHEWFSPDFHDRTYLPLQLMLLALVAGLALLPRCPRLRTLVLLLATIPAALRSIRHIPILVLVLVPLLAELAQAGLQQSGANRLFRTPLTGSASRTFLINFLVLFAFVTFTAFRVRQVVSQQADSGCLPATAASSRTDDEPLQLGRIFHLEALPAIPCLHGRPGRRLRGRSDDRFQRLLLPDRQLEKIPADLGHPDCRSAPGRSPDHRPSIWSGVEADLRRSRSCNSDQTTAVPAHQEPS
jgi:hypothetical protein